MAETYEEHMRQVLAAGGAHECASDCPVPLPRRMTEDRVPHPPDCDCLTCRADYEEQKARAMTEDRASPRTKAGQRHLQILREWCDDGLITPGTLIAAEDGLAAIEAEASDQPAPPLDVERLAEAMGNRKWAWLGWVDGEAPDNDMRFRRWTVLRNAANELAAEYARLGSAATQRAPYPQHAPDCTSPSGHIGFCQTSDQ